MSKFYRSLTIFLASIGVVAAISFGGVAMAATGNPIFDESCKATPTSTLCQPQTQKLFGPNSIWTNIINTIIFIIGAVAVLMVVIGGLRYTLSGGDAGSTKSAKDTILYAIIGLVIAVAAYAIVNFILVSVII